MTLQPFSDEQLNFFKFSSVVLNEFPKALRQTFKTMWDYTYGGRPGFQLWDDSTAVRNLFATTEGGRTKVPIGQSYNDWDCTNLFQATIFSRSFASPASTGSYTTLSDLYVKPRALPHGSFHACVLSPGGNNEETMALAIDQVRLLRNSLCHSASSEMDKLTFDQCVNYAKDAFQALGLATAPIDAVGSLTESDFPTNEVRALEMRQRDETRAYINFLEEVNSDISEVKATLQALKAGQEQQYWPILSSLSSDVSDVKQKVEEDVANKGDITKLETSFDQCVNYAKDAFQALGLATPPIDAVGSLTESDFPTNEVRALEMRQRDETRAYINFLEEVNSDISEVKATLQALKAGQEQQYWPILSSLSSDVSDVKQKVEEDVANKGDITRLEKKMDELKEGQRERDAQSKNSGILSKKRTLKT